MSPKTIPQCTFTNISTGLPRNLKVANLIARILNFPTHETFAKLNVRAIAFESISLLLPNLCSLLVIVL